MAKDMEKKQDTPPTTTPLMTQSRLMDFLRCERLEWFKYRVNGVGITPIKPEVFFLEGEFGHYALQHWYANAKAGGLMLRKNMMDRINKSITELGEVTPEFDLELRQRMSAMIGACFAYKVRYKADLSQFKFTLIEEPFEVEVDGMKLGGKIDLGVETKDGKIGFWEHKFLASYSAEDYTSLPLNLQQLIYTVGFRKLMGKWPDFYMWNVIKKSSLRRKGMVKKDGSIPTPEPLIEFEVRVQNQYLEEPDKMFIRTPPRPIEVKAMESAMESVKFHIQTLIALSMEDKPPPMRFSSCQGRYGQACPFSPACCALMLGHKQGWNAPECRGLYQVKEKQYPELEEK